MIGKTILAYFILSLLQLPLVLLKFLPGVADGADSSWSVAVRLVLGVFVILVYLPISFFIAASAAGFCPAVSASPQKHPGNVSR